MSYGGLLVMLQVSASKSACRTTSDFSTENLQPTYVWSLCNTTIEAITGDARHGCAAINSRPGLSTWCSDISSMSFRYIGEEKRKKQCRKEKVNKKE